METRLRVVLRYLGVLARYYCVLECTFLRDLAERPLTELRCSIDAKTEMAEGL